MLTLFLCGEFLLQNPCWLPFLSGTFSYTSDDDVNFIWWVSFTHPVLASFLSGSFSYTSRAVFSFINWSSLTHPMLVLYLPEEFLLHILCWLNFLSGVFLFLIPIWLHFYAGSLFYIPCWLFLCGEFLLHTPCCLHFNAGSFSYTSRAGSPFYQLRFSYTYNAGFIFIWGVFLTHPMLALFFCGEFLWHIPWRFFF